MAAGEGGLGPWESSGPRGVAGTVFRQRARFLGTKGRFRAAATVFGQQGRSQSTHSWKKTKKIEFLNHILLINSYE